MNLRLLAMFVLFSNSLLSQNFIKKLFPNDPSQGAYFGRFIAQERESILVGAYKDSEQASASGTIYFFKNINGEYIQTQKIFPEDGMVDQFFGYSIGIFGDWVITGAHHDSSKGASSGAAYIIKKNSINEWNIAQKLVPEQLSEGDEFGKKVDVYGRFAVSSAYLNDKFGVNSGVVYLYELKNGIWDEHSILHASDSKNYSQFGLSLDLFKDRLIIGAPLYSDNERGAAYIFENKEGIWSEAIKLSPDELEENDEFGITVKVNDDFAFISSIKDDENGVNSGAVYVYQNTNNKWGFLQKIYAPDGDEEDYFGIDIALSDSIVAIGAYFDDDNGENSGSVYIYKNINNIWTFIKKIKPEDGEESDAFGSSISINENRLLVGAFSDSDKGFLSGSAYLFNLDKIVSDENLVLKDKVKVYPSVFIDRINIESESGGTNIIIYNIEGGIAHKIYTVHNICTLNLEGLVDGIYIMKVITKSYSKSYKIVKSN